MAIRIVDTVEPDHKPASVDKLKAARDRKVYKREWMRRRRVLDRVDAILLAKTD
jgi:hypothetical protein